VVLQDDGFLHPCLALNKFYLQCASYYKSQSQNSPDRYLCGQKNSVLHLLFTADRPVKPVLRLISIPPYLLLRVRLFYITVYELHPRKRCIFSTSATETHHIHRKMDYDFNTTATYTRTAIVFLQTSRTQYHYINYHVFDKFLTINIFVFFTLPR
jgi:hypothetical protein